jgi:Tfp pilus assembly protein PilO
MSLQVTPRTLALLLAGLVALLGLGGWFGLVAAQKNSASSLGAQVADAQVNLDALQSPAQPAKHTNAAGKAKAAAKQKAAKQASQAAQLQAALPTQVQMPSLLLEVQKLATRAGVTLESFAPSMPMPQSGYDSIPIDVTVAGRYRGIQRFVHLLRVQALPTKSGVQATGRLFAVETVNITAASDGLPALTATIMLDAFVYSGVFPPTEAETGTDGSTPATTTTSEGTS